MDDPGHGSRQPATGVAWIVLALSLAVASVLVGWGDADRLDRLDWQPGKAWSQPWRLWTAATVHWSAQHLALNLSGCAALAALGWAAQLGTPAAAAWFLSWPLLHAGLWWRPELQHYGGMSGVLHAGVAVAALCLARSPDRRSRIGGWCLAGVLAGKVLLEAPWGPSLRAVAGADLQTAPWAHACGVLAGALAATWLPALVRLRRRIPSESPAVAARTGADGSGTADPAFHAASEAPLPDRSA